MNTYFFIACILMCVSCQNTSETPLQTVSKKTSTTSVPPLPVVSSQDVLYAEGTMTLTCHPVSGDYKEKFKSRVFASPTKRLSFIDAQNIMNTYLQSDQTCEVFDILRKRYSNNLQDVRVDIHVTDERRVLEPILQSETADIQVQVDNVLPYAFEYLRQAGINLSQTSATYVHDVDYAGGVSTVDTWFIVFTRQQSVYFDFVARWLVGTDSVVASSGAMPFSSYGEAGQNMTFYVEMDSQLTITNFIDNPIIIDAHDVPAREIFESVFFEIIHKSVSDYRIKKMMEELNAPGGSRKLDALVAEYVRYEEVMVHYVGICLMYDLYTKGMYPDDVMTNYIKKYKNGLNYRGLVELLQKYPPGTKNAKFIAEVFMDDPRRIATL